MTSVSALNYIHKTGLFGNHDNKKENNIMDNNNIH